ncbi:hypothetical protein XELAEV_18034244mg [Xenopus laevis]|nr:hypothetical protein XELAEV_18034244mg [Xenopus laevis]
MSDNELFEKDIWEYKSKQKVKQPSNKGTRSADRGKAKQKAAQKPRSSLGARTQPPSRNVSQTSTIRAKRQLAQEDGEKPVSQREQPTPTLTPPNKNQSPPKSPRSRHDGYCPSCQMPFSLLLVQSPRWHVSECLDAAGATAKECPDGVMCSSAIPSHYKIYSHFQLAQSRAVNDSVFSLLNTPGSAGHQPVKLNLSQSPISWVKISENINKNRQNSPKTLSQTPKKDKSPASSQGSVKQSSLHAWLSSPSKNEKPSQEILSNPHPGCADSTANNPQSAQQPADLGEYGISYSPLIFNEELDSDEDPIKKLFPSESSEEEHCGTADKRQQVTNQSHGPQENGMIPPLKYSNISQQDLRLFNPGADHRNHISASSTSQCAANQQQSDHIPDYANWSECSSPAPEIGEWDTYQTQPDLFGERAPRFGNSTRWKGESIPVVEAGRRESCSIISQRAQVSEPEPALSLGSHKDKLVLTLSQKIPAMPSKTVQSCANSKGMKQMDIGVFFGLKPKAKEDPKTKVPPKPQNQHDVALPSESKPGQRKRKGQGSLGDKDPLADHTNTEPEGATGNQRGGWKRPRQFSTGGEGKGKKQCPFYKKIPGTGFAVDAFQYGQIEGCSAYFLTHFHSDHYGGLTKKFRFPIYCSKITGNLVQNKLRVESEFINTLPMNTECVVNGIRVVLLEANHCPGAVLLLFRLPNGTSVLHTGDFRADRSMESYPALIGQRVHTLYLDTTYCSPEYTFPPQQETIQFAVNIAFEMVTLYPRTLVVCGTYSVGKEKVFLAIADVLGCKVCMSQDKYKTMQCLESEDIRSLVTTDWHSTALHVLPMMQVNFKGLNVHLGKFPGKYDRVLAFKPTGWTYSDSSVLVADIKPEIRGKVTVYGIPYSEHSSYSELKRFVQWLKPQKIIPTVNVGNYNSRSAMEKYFREWLSDAAQKK